MKDYQSAKYAEAVESQRQYDLKQERCILRSGIVAFKVNFSAPALAKLHRVLCEKKEEASDLPEKRNFPG